MRTFEVIIDENISDNNPLQTQKDIKGVLDVKEKNGLLLKSEDWVRPGIPATEEQIIRSVEEAESSNQFFTLEEVRILLQSKYDGR